MPDRGGRLGAETSDTNVVVEGNMHVAGLQIVSLNQGSPLGQFDIYVGDIIYAIDGKLFATPTAMRRYLANYTPGSRLQIYVLHKANNFNGGVLYTFAMGGTYLASGQVYYPQPPPPPVSSYLGSRARANCPDLDDDQTALNLAIAGSWLWNDFKLTTIATMTCFVKNNGGCQIAACAYLWAYSGQCAEFLNKIGPLADQQRRINHERRERRCYVRVEPLNRDWA